MNIAPTGYVPLPENPQSYQPDDTDENPFESHDPELMMRKKLLETFFGKDKAHEKESDKEKITENSSPPHDTVELSRHAIELYKKQTIEIRIENSEQQVEIRFEHSEMLRVEASVSETQPQVQQADPLMLDLDGNGLQLTDVRKNEGVRFDITGDGTVESVSWLSPTDGFLALDRNGNGVIDNGKELFGDQHGAENGFLELSIFDDNQDGGIDTNDDIYRHLQVWRDLNGNGYSEQNELEGMKTAGIEKIALAHDTSREIIEGNLVAGYARFETSQTSGRIGEVFLNFVA